MGNTMSITKSRIPWKHKKLMEVYESLTGHHSLQLVNDGVHSVYIEVWNHEYIDWLAEHVEDMLNEMGQ